MRTALYLLLGFTAALLLMEALLQLAPVQSGLRKVPTGEAAPNFRFVPEQRYVYSHGWAMDNARRGRINHDGYNNSAPMRDGARVLVLGDSYVESMMLDYAETVQGQLDRALGGGVYAAAASGNGLADSLQLMRELGPRLHPRNVIVLVEAQDVSTLLDAPTRGHSRFAIRDGVVGLEHHAYQGSKARDLLMHSALVRYLAYNLKFPEWLNARLAALRPRPAVAATPALAAQRRQVLDYYLAQMQGLAARCGSRIVFLVDADRQRIYAGGEHSVGWQAGDREWLLQRLRDSGAALVDLQPAFAQYWRRHRERFDFQPMDGHWNMVGHAIAVQQLLPLIPSEPAGQLAIRTTGLRPSAADKTVSAGSR
jgi:hypothetical protein